MQLYQKVLFVGAKGEYENMPFEVLGNGQVDYTIKQVGNPNNYDDVGGTFPAVEYYCLANNGQTWYFAVSDNEVYYCRQLEKDEIDKLKIEMQAEEFSVQSFLGGKYNTSLVEYGLGKLNKAEGRALKDSREFAEFEYLDFKVGQKSYSIDIFPDNYEEWFETIWVPNNKLTEIFKDSLRLGNHEVGKIFETAKLWKNIGIGCFVVAGLILTVAIILATQTKQIYSQKKEISTAKDSEIIFEDIEIREINKIYTLENEVSLPSNQGISLNLTLLNQKDEVVSSSIQEFTNASGENKQKFNTDFFPDKKEKFKLLVKVNDYGVVGSNTSSSSSSSSSITSSNSDQNNLDTTSEDETEIPDNSPKISITIRLFKDSVMWLGWIFAIIIVILTGIGALVYKIILERKAWLENPRATGERKTIQ
jgi:hypothetical protein